MARPEPRNRQTNPPNRPTKRKTVFVDSRRRDAASRTLTLSDKDSVERNTKTSLLIAIDTNGFRRMKEEGLIYKILPQIF